MALNAILPFIQQGLEKTPGLLQNQSNDINDQADALDVQSLAPGQPEQRKVNPLELLVALGGALADRTGKFNASYQAGLGQTINTENQRRALQDQQKRQQLQAQAQALRNKAVRIDAKGKAYGDASIRAKEVQYRQKKDQTELDQWLKEFEYKKTKDEADLAVRQQEADTRKRLSISKFLGGKSAVERVTNLLAARAEGYEVSDEMIESAGRQTESEKLSAANAQGAISKTDRENKLLPERIKRIQSQIKTDEATATKIAKETDQMDEKLAIAQARAETYAQAVSNMAAHQQALISQGEQKMTLDAAKTMETNIRSAMTTLTTQADAIRASVRNLETIPGGAAATQKEQHQMALQRLNARYQELANSLSGVPKGQALGGDGLAAPGTLKQMFGGNSKGVGPAKMVGQIGKGKTIKINGVGNVKITPLN